MANSKKTTCLAVLRHLTSLSAKEFGLMVGRKVDWMKRIESGKLPLRVDVARLVAHETGVSLDWLLRGDPNRQCLAWDGAPYTARTFNQYRAKLASERPDQLRWCNPAAYLPVIFSIARAAADKYQVELFADALSVALGKLASRFGENHNGGDACRVNMSKHSAAFNLVVSERHPGEETDALMEFSGHASKFLRDSIKSGWIRTGRVAMVDGPGQKKKITIRMAKDGSHACVSMLVPKVKSKSVADRRKRPSRKSQG